MKAKELGFSVAALLLATVGASAKTVVVDYFIGTEYKGTATEYVSPRAASIDGGSVTFSLTNAPFGYHVLDWAVCNSGDVVNRRLIGNYTMLGIGDVTSYIWTDTSVDVGTLAVIFEGDTYTISFSPNCETYTGSMTDQAIGYGASSPLHSNRFNRPGYTFKGWSLYNDILCDFEGKSEVIPNGTTVTGAMVAGLADASGILTLYAVWEGGNYNVHFDGNGATSGAMGDKSYTFGKEGEYLPPSLYERIGYEFAGWNTRANGKGTAYEDEAEVLDLAKSVGETVTLYAQWAPGKFVVSFEGNGGTGTMAAQEFDYDGKLVPLNANVFTRVGYKFAGWNTEPEPDKATPGKSYTDKQKVKFTVSEFPPEEYDGELVLYAQWTPVECKIRLHRNGADGGADIGDMIFSMGADDSLRERLPDNTYTLTHYTFTGWNTMPDGTGNAYSDQAYAYTVASYAYTTSPGRDVTITLYAQWEEDTYNVNFNSNNGTGETKVQEMLFDVVTELDENSFTWPGYAFQGWSETRGGAVQYADRAEVENFYEKDAAGDLAGEKTLYAVWAESQYKVRFMKNGVDAKETMADQEFTYDDSQRLRRVAFTRERYAFTGWNTMPDGTGTSFDDQAFGYQIATEEADGIVVLYAQWAAESYNIHFVGNGGHSADENSGSGGQTNEIIVVRKTQTVGYGLTVKLDENDFLRTGYAFTGWSESRDGSDKTHYEDCAEVTDFYNADGTEKVLYAQWEPVSYTVRFNPNCDDYTGGPMPDQTFTYGEYSNLARNTFKREGWVFAGWNTSSDGEGGVWLADQTLASRLTTDSGDLIVLYAQWEREAYDIIFYANDGGGVNGTGDTPVMQRAERGAVVILKENEFVRAGYAFDGWNTKPDGTGLRYDGAAGNYADMEDVGVDFYDVVGAKVVERVLYAVWKPVGFTVYFDPNGGDVTNPDAMASQGFTFGSSSRLRKNVYERPRYAFLGWNTMPDGSGTAYEDQAFGHTIVPDSGKSVKLYAQWAAESYNINFNSNDGTETIVAQTVGFGVDVTLRANTFVRAGYEFAGWSTTRNGAVEYEDEAQVGENFYDVVGGKVVERTLYAVWEPNRYTVKFDPNGGKNTMADQEFTYGDMTTNPNLNLNTFTRDGYTFAGWNTMPDGSGTAYADGAVGCRMIAKDGIVVLYAQWVPNNYIVLMYANDGSDASVTQEFKYGTAQRLLQNSFSLVGHQFDGWSKIPDGPKVYDDCELMKDLDPDDNGIVKLYARWVPVSYTITFNGNGADGPEKMGEVINVTYESAQTLPTNRFTRTGWTFDRWNTQPNGSGTYYDNGAEVSKITGGKNVVLYAIWTRNTYKVVFDPNGGKGTMADQTFTYGISQYLTANAFKKDGQRFIGWSTSKSGKVEHEDRKSVSNLTDKPNGLVTLYAQWGTMAFSVMFEPNYEGFSADKMEPQEFTYGKAGKLSANEYTRKGYGFESWNTNPDGSGRSIKDQGTFSIPTDNPSDVTMYAQWTGLTYKVVFNPNGGMGTMDPQTFTNGEEQALSECGFTMTGFGFNGWSLTPDGPEKCTDGQSVIDLDETLEGNDVTLYARWGDPIKYTIKFDRGDGGEGEDMPDMTDVQYDTSVTLSKNTYTKPGNAFIGWKLSGSSIAENNGKMYGDEAVVANLTSKKDGVVTMTATWNENAYYVAFSPNYDDFEAFDGALMQPQKFHVGVEGTLTKCTYERSNYEFQHWTNTVGDVIKDGAAYKSDDPSDVGKTIWLYAVWEYKDGVSDIAKALKCDNLGWDVVNIDNNSPVKYKEFEMSPEEFRNWVANASGNVATESPGGLSEIKRVLCAPISEKGSLTFSYKYDGGGSATFLYLLDNSQYTIYVTDTKDKKKEQKFVQLTDETNWTECSLNITDEVSKENPSYIHIGFTGSEPTKQIQIKDMKWEPSDGGSKNDFTDKDVSAKGYTGTNDGFEHDGITVKAPEGAVVFYHLDSKPTSIDGWNAAVPKVKDVGQYTIWYKVTETNHNTLVSNVTATVKAAAKAKTASLAKVKSIAVANAIASGKGAVIEPKSIKAGKVATWKAKAETGSVFAHWSGNFVNGLGLSKNELRNPSLKFKVPNGFNADDIKAVFVPVDVDTLDNVELGGAAGNLQIGVATSGLLLVDDSASYVTATVKGLPTGLKFNKKTLAITGTPKKGGTFTLKVSAKNASGRSWSGELQLVVADPVADAIRDGLDMQGPSFDDAAGAFSWRVGVAVAGDDGIALDVASALKFSATGLPAGVKIAPKTGRFIGVPKKSGAFSAKIKIKSSSKASFVIPVKINVAQLDDWAKGVFYGSVQDGGEEIGTVNPLKVSAAGKFNGKMVLDGARYKLSATSYAAYDGKSGTYTAQVLCKSGKTTVTTEVTVSAETVDGSKRGVMAGDLFNARQK